MTIDLDAARWRTRLEGRLAERRTPEEERAENTRRAAVIAEEAANPKPQSDP